MRAFVVPLAVAAISCAAARPVPPLAKAPVVAVAPAPVVPPPCPEGTLALEMAERFEVSCFPGSCPLALAFRVASGLTQDASFVRFSLVSRDGSATEWELEDARTVSPRTRSESTEVSTYARGDFVFRVTVESNGRRFVLAQAVSLVDVAFERGRAACVEGGGKWHAVGLSGTVVCDEPLLDAGAPCSDDRECAGRCELVKRHDRPSGRARPGAPAGMVKVDGRCTASRFVFGCHTFVGHTDGGLVPRGTHFAHVCTD